MTSIVMPPGGGRHHERQSQRGSLVPGKVYTYAKTLSRLGGTDTHVVNDPRDPSFAGITGVELIVFRYEGSLNGTILGATNPLLQEAAGKPGQRIDFTQYTRRVNEFQGLRRVIRNIPIVGFTSLLIGGRRMYPASRELLTRGVRVRVKRRHIIGSERRIVVNKRFPF